MDRLRMFGQKEEKVPKEMCQTQNDSDPPSAFQFLSVDPGTTETAENTVELEQTVPGQSLRQRNTDEASKGFPDAKKSPLGDQQTKDSTNRKEKSSTSDLRMRVFKTKLSLDLKPFSRSNSKSNVLRKIDEVNECMVLEGGEVVRLRISSTSSTRSYRGEVSLNTNTGGSCSSTSSSAGSPMDFSLPGTPESPTPDIDNVFAQRMRETMDSPDNMAEVIELARKLKFAPPKSEVGHSEIRQRLSEAQFVAASFSSCVVEEHDGEGDTLTNLPEQLSDEDKNKKLQRSLDWLRMELLAMKKQDQDIARQLMSIHLKIQRLRLQWSVQNHKTILENVALDTEEEKECTSNLLELPEHLRFLESSPRAYLRDMGLTKLNMTNRRFSLR